MGSVLRCTARMARIALRDRFYARMVPNDFRPKARKQRILSIAFSAVQSWDLPAGDYLEFGVYEGKSFIYAYKLAEQMGLEMHFYAFDSFEGLPLVRGRDAEYGTFEQGQYACDEARFRQNLKKAGVDMSRVTIVPGFYDQVLNSETKSRLRIKRAAVVFIDCDLYESTVSVLRFISGYLTNGSILIFDDWFCFGADPTGGELGATREWLEQNRHIRLVEYYKFGVSGISFIVQIDEA